MTTPDDELMDRLRRIAAEVDAAPELVAESARAAFLTRRLDDELAELLHDSALSPSAPVRGPSDGPRVLSYESGEISLELALDVRGERLSLTGLAVGASGEIEVETRTTGSRRARVDDDHGFAVEDLPVEPLRVRLRRASGAEITTGWIRP